MFSGDTASPPVSTTMSCASVATAARTASSGQRAKKRRRILAAIRRHYKTTGRQTNGATSRDAAPLSTGDYGTSAVGDRELRLGLFVELLVLARSLERGGRRLGALDCLRHCIEVARAD